MKPASRPAPRPARGPRPLRIVHVVSSLLVGGMEQFVLRLAAEQQGQGHQVTVVGLRGGPLQEEARRLRLEVTTFDEGRKVSRIARGIACMARVRPHIAHAHNPAALPYALLARLSHQTRVVMTRHGQLADWTPSPIEQRYTDAIVAVSEAAAAALRAKRPDVRKLSVILNGVHLSAAARSRSDVRAELGLGEGLVGIIVARLDRLKGHASLLQALALLRKRDIPLTMLVAGDGPERANLEDLAAQLQLDRESVRFLGYRSDVPDLLGASDFFVLPSLTEGLPLSVLEAMAHGLPVVATPVGGIPELVTDGEQGTLIPVDEPVALSQAIAALATVPGQRARQGEAARRRAREQFSFESMTRKYEDLYYRLCAH
ncbi:MAG TPA: glycosyltransferase [Armatimonadota bacterium]|nr:glycosyltransferase [Armatimonadota bacterium]